MLDEISREPFLVVAFILLAAVSVLSYTAFRVSDAGRMETCLANGHEWRGGDCVKPQGAPR